MYSLLTVNQQVSLISVTVTPSTFLAALLVILVFVSFYLPQLPSLNLPRITLPRFLTAANNDNALPPSPTSPSRQLVLRDQSLTIYRRDKKESSSSSFKDRFRKEPKDHYKERDYYPKETDHGRSPRKARRLITGFRDSGKPAVYDEELIRSPPQRSGDRGRSPSGPGRRVRRFLFSSSVAEARQR
ncbi:hypothetical protein J3F84DRAFT_347703 [Trichoderma pleuroticola]|uniref:Uncharacterized protein n=1 Tax=Trichoderma harzianum TaxID=5544 RepID=A0A2K0UR02_TRIHA|nr:hypothetical protein THARTR1_00228 [Trichoderma harzianum]